MRKHLPYKLGIDVFSSKKDFFNKNLKKSILVDHSESSVGYSLPMTYVDGIFGKY